MNSLQGRQSEPIRPAVDQATLLDVARCPLCAGPLSVRQGSRGPYFACLCTKNVNHAPPQHVNASVKK